MDRRRLVSLAAWLAVGVILAVAAAKWGLGLLLVVLIAVWIITQYANQFKSIRAPSFTLRMSLIILGNLGSVIALNMQSSPWVQVHQFPGDHINLAMSTDGSLVAAGDGTSIEVRDTETGEPLSALHMTSKEVAERTMAGGGDWLYLISFAQDGKSLLAADWRADMDVSLYDWQAGERVRSWATSSARVCREGHRFCGVSNKAEFCVYDINQDAPILVVQDIDCQRCFSLSPHGKFLLVVDWVNAELWDVDAKRRVGIIPASATLNGWAIPEFTADESAVAIPTAKGVVIYDVQQCKKIGEWQPPNLHHVRTLEWSPDGTRLAATYIETTPTSADIHHCFLLDRVGNEIGQVTGNSPTFSPSGDRIATVDGTVHISDGKSGERLTRIPFSLASESATGWQRSIYFSSNGEWLFHSGSPTVHRRRRPEWWYSIFGVPAFWGVIVFLTLLIREHLVAAIKQPLS